MIRRPRQELQENHERWLLTYADLITLLLALFIVMFSMSQIDNKRFDAMSTALNGILKGGDLVLREKGLFAAADREFGGPMNVGQLRLLQQRVKQEVETSGMGESISSVMTDRGLVIHITEGALFEEAKARLAPGAMNVLRVVGQKLQKTQNQIRVEGHTDPRPIKTAQFPSNWELSTARAASVLRFLVDSTSVAPERISALGFGEFRPIADNDNPLNMAKNRRVDIVILSRRMSLSEPEGTAYTDTEQPELPGDLIP